MKQHGNFRHGESGYSITPLYRVWRTMHERCRSPRHRNYSIYGGRGIKVCERWSGPRGFINFRADMGERPLGMTLERVDNDGDYEPSNVRWATMKEQANNTRRNRRLTAQNGRTQTLTQWANELGITVSTLAERITHWGVTEALAMPKGKRHDR